MEVFAVKKEQDAEAMKSIPDWEPPDLVLRDPQETAPGMYVADWTKVPGSNKDSQKFRQEKRLRDFRSEYHRQLLGLGLAVTYTSTGHSMWPLVQSNDTCRFLPTQAVTAKGGADEFQKDESELGVGDIVFCKIQETGLFFAHFILEITRDDQGPVYSIGNIRQHKNGTCRRQHIFGILVSVNVFWRGRYWQRPHPKQNYRQCSELVRVDQWNPAAEALCRPAV